MPTLRGVLQLGFDKRPVKDRISLLYERGLYLILGYLAVGLLLAWGSGTLLSRSIRQLRDAARRDRRRPYRRGARDTDGDLRSLEPDPKPRVHAPGTAATGKELQTLAYYDNLTGLANRTLFNQSLTEALATAERNNTEARRHLSRSRPVQAR